MKFIHLPFISSFFLIFSAACCEAALDWAQGFNLKLPCNLTEGEVFDCVKTSMLPVLETHLLTICADDVHKGPS